MSMVYLIMSFVLLISFNLQCRNPFSFVGKTKEIILQPNKKKNVHSMNVHVEHDIARTDTQWNISDECSDAIVLRHKDDGHVCQIQLTTT